MTYYHVNKGCTITTGSIIIKVLLLLRQLLRYSPIKYTDAVLLLNLSLLSIENSDNSTSKRDVIPSYCRRQVFLSMYLRGETKLITRNGTKLISNNDKMRIRMTMSRWSIPRWRVQNLNVQNSFILSLSLFTSINNSKIYMWIELLQYLLYHDEETSFVSVNQRRDSETSFHKRSNSFRSNSAFTTYCPEELIPISFPPMLATANKYSWTVVNDSEIGILYKLTPKSGSSIN